MKYCKENNLICTLKLFGFGVLFLLFIFYVKPTDNFTNMFVFIPQILVLLPVFYFLNNTINIILEEIKNEKTKTGAIPILAIVYIGVVIIYTGTFIKNFQFLLSYCDFNLRNILDSTRPEANYDFYLIPIKILVILSFIAFICNFYKSLFTIHSLEFGKFGDELTLKEMFNSKKWKVGVEIIFRLAIVVLFVWLEKILAENSEIMDNYTNYKLFKKLGWLVMILYFIMGIWLICVNYFNESTENKINKKWLGWTIIQFAGGLIVGFTLLLLGGVFTNYYALDIIGAIYILSIIASVFVLITIGLNEFKYKVTG